MPFAIKNHGESRIRPGAEKAPAGTMRRLADKPIEKGAAATEAALPKAVMALAAFCKAETPEAQILDEPSVRWDLLGIRPLPDQVAAI